MKKRLKQMTGSMAAKAAAWFLLTVMAVLTAASVAGAILLFRCDFYTQGRDQIKQSAFESMGTGDAFDLLTDYLDNGAEAAEDFCVGKNFTAVILREDGTRLWASPADDAARSTWSVSVPCGEKDNNSLPEAERQTYTVELTIDGRFPQTDAYALANRAINAAYALRYWVYVIGAASLALGIGCFVFLLCAAGHRAGREEIAALPPARMPLDLLALLVFLAAVWALSFFLDEIWYGGTAAAMLWSSALYVMGVAAGTWFCTNLAVRAKLGGMWKNTLVYRVAKPAGQGLTSVFRNLPLLWKTVTFLLLLTLAEGIVLGAISWTGDLIPFWLLEKLALSALVLYLALALRKLEKGAQALAAGDLAYQVDTRRMWGDFRRHGENLNSIAGGMTRAVEERLKSERLKTELITNVSHDIKTPLTSIINYADLIGKEPTDNPAITEYAEVLHRQSERLKKLIEDLVEASKASTGNVEVHAAPCEIGVLLTQAAGEYEQRLKEKNLELITRQPDGPVRISADGRHLWRVFDNLMNNICKYALGGTRVYFSAEEENGEALIAFKNISRYPLDLSADELRERFVRGDRSRNTEGSGLGLSIAQSLTELQGGKLELSVDGDLFKAVLRFPLLEEGGAARTAPSAQPRPETLPREKSPVRWGKLPALKKGRKFFRKP
ncbi:MAG: HAMP domain-containing histidine kinase [Oscillibacter sp.]|jgi:signal transduction histidine kinase|nr:HAMP domain-containing histidine kinase [Oscillibacter sp.]